MSAAAIITARGGSKRIPRKNIRDFCGKPMIAYSIEAALESGIFDEVMVSTDSMEIADVAKEYGASVPFLRSERTSGDYATTADVLLEVLSEYEKLGRKFSYMACIYPTALFVTAKKLRNAFQLLVDSGAYAVMPVVSFSFPPQRGMFVRDGKLEYFYTENSQNRSQDLEPVYHDCGQFYFYRTDKYCACRGHMDLEYVPMVMPEMEVQDIDNLSDWEIAEMKYKLFRKEMG